VYAASAVFSDPARMRGTGKKPAANRASGYSILSANSTINANTLRQGHRNGQVYCEPPAVC
jgi:hypothetical protein